MMALPSQDDDSTVMTGAAAVGTQLNTLNLNVSTSRFSNKRRQKVQL
jgi:hypothetical protein